jgi:aconitate hydratase
MTGPGPIMSTTMNHFGALKSFRTGDDQEATFYSLPALEAAGLGKISRLPVSIRLVLESVLRHCDGVHIREADVRALANWPARGQRTDEIPFVVARIVLQDFTGVPLLVDLAAMRSAVARLGRDPALIEPLVPVDLVVDHSVQVDFAGFADALQHNLAMEFQRNRERYQFLKWGMQAFETFKVVPPGIGIVHQVNLEYLAQGVLRDAAGVYYPDTLVGTDSHTTMINGLGIVGWGVGGIEAEAGMLGQPVYFLTPDVVGVHLTGSLREGVTATDIALTVTQMLRRAKVVGKFVEFFGPGASALPVVDRATIANMAPEYGATMGFFPIDEESVKYLRATGRTEVHCRTYENYYRAQGLFGVPQRGQIDYTTELELDLGSVVPSVAGPKRPQDRIDLPDLKRTFLESLARSPAENGFGKTQAELAIQVRVQSDTPATGAIDQTYGHRKAQVSPSESEMRDQHPTPDTTSALPPSAFPPFDAVLHHGRVLIAAITSCTNTSNPSVMLAAGLLARKAVERGLRVDPVVKCSLAPGSRVVTDYLERTGLQPYLDQLGFNLVGYGCTTCIGNSGPLAPSIEEAITRHDLITASVLSGNRNFEARVHPSIKANFLMSPPLVVAYALAGRIDLDLSREPLGRDTGGNPVFLRELWPTLSEIREVLATTVKPEVFRRLYQDFANQNPLWNQIVSSQGEVYAWDAASTYIQEPPFFQDFALEPKTVTSVKGARALGIFGDSVTTDHISPAGSIKKTSPAGQYLLEHNVSLADFNSYGSRRGNDRIMTRGTFANVRIKNLMVPGTEGGVTIHQPSGNTLSIFDAAMKYAEERVPLLVFAGHEYGTGSSRDWAAKGTALLGVRAVIAQSYERIHRSNLIGMGVLPLQFKEEASARSLQLDGTELFDLQELPDHPRPLQDLLLTIHRANGTTDQVALCCRIDTPIEIEYYRHGGILPYVLRQLLNR